MKRFQWAKQSFENVVPFDLHRARASRSAVQGHKGIVLPFHHRHSVGASSAILSRPNHPVMWAASMVLLALMLVFLGPSVQWNMRQ
jgi:hypothetical protein